MIICKWVMCPAMNFLAWTTCLACTAQAHVPTHPCQSLRMCTWLYTQEGPCAIEHPYQALRTWGWLYAQEGPCAIKHPPRFRWHACTCLCTQDHVPLSIPAKIGSECCMLTVWDAARWEDVPLCVLVPYTVSYHLCLLFCKLTCARVCMFSC